MKERELWDLAGFTDEDTGRLQAFLPEGEGIWTPPKVEKVERLGEAFVAFPNSAEGWERKAERTGLLDAFLKLRGDPKKIIRFAEKWGPLWREGKVSPDKRRFIEPVAAWQAAAQQAHDIVSLAAYLKADKNRKPPPDLLDRLCCREVNWLGEKEAEKLNWRGLAKAVIKGLLEQETKRFGVAWRWTENTLEMELCFGMGFLPVLWFQVAQAITGTSGVFICDGCGLPYIRTGRKPQSGRRQFCPPCSEGGKGSRRLHKRMKRERPKDAGGKVGQAGRLRQTGRKTARK